MVNEETEISRYLAIIGEIEKVRTNNNVNWMDVLRLAFIHAPEEARKLMKKINQEDKKISHLFEELSE
jgi:hypothetical protein